MNNKLKIGLLGCGGIAQVAHLPALRKAENVDFTAICDASEELVERMAVRYEVEDVYIDHNEFLEKADMDAVLLAVGHAFHAPLSIDCMRAGKHVLCEKPMAMSVPECEEIVQVSEESGMKFQLACMKRYDPGAQFAREFVANEMGERLSVDSWYCDSVFHGQYVQTFNLPIVRSSSQKRPEVQGDRYFNLILGHGVHAVDFIRYFAGDIVAVTTKKAEKSQDVALVSLLEFADGACGTFQLVSVVKMDWYEGITVHGQNGSVQVRVKFPYFKRPADVSVFDANTGEYRSPVGADSDPYERQLEAFASAILEDRGVMPSAVDGLADQKVLDAIYESMKTGERVKIS